jgi:hypothetical protein
LGQRSHQTAKFICDYGGGSIYLLPAQEFGYPAEGGAEFVNGAAPVTPALMREARLSLSSIEGTQWSARRGVLSPDESPPPHAVRLHQALRELKTDLPIAEFLKTHFADRRYSELRRTITGMVEGYDAADPRRASTLALRDEAIANLTSSIMVGADVLNVGGDRGFKSLSLQCRTDCGQATNGEGRPHDNILALLDVSA